MTGYTDNESRETTSKTKHAKRRAALKLVRQIKELPSCSVRGVAGRGEAGSTPGTRPMRQLAPPHPATKNKGELEWRRRQQHSTTNVR